MLANLGDRDSSTTAKSMLDFSDQCRLDISLNACHRFYVVNATVDKNTSMLEVCREIASLKQEYRDGNGRLVVDTPEELFMKFLAYAGSLPDCARDWPIQLCSTYYTALSSVVTNRMMSQKTHLSPSLIGLDTKQVQLEALQVVREGATFQYKELADEVDRIDIKLKLMPRASGRSSLSHYSGADAVCSGEDYNNERIIDAYMLN